MMIASAVTVRPVIAWPRLIALALSRVFSYFLRKK
jgi:hypothetical protein